MNKWYFEVINNWDDIWRKTNLARWNSVMRQSSSAHVFFHPALIKAWVDTYIPLQKMQPIFIWAKDNSGNEGFFPLVLWKRNWKNAFIRCIVPMGYSDFDYHNPIFLRPVQDLNSFWRQLLDYIEYSFHYDQITLDGITDAMTCEALFWNQDEICPYMALDNINNEQQLLYSLKTSLRGDVRRQIRRLKEVGVLSFTTYHQPEDVWPTFDSFLEEHRHRWPNAYKAPLFHRHLIEQGLKDGLVHFSSLNIDNQPIAWHLGFSYRKRFYYYMPAGNNIFANYSPVKIHLYYLIKWSIEKKYELYDHLKGDENYKTGWSNGYQYVNSLTKRSKGFTTSLKMSILKLRK